MQLPADRIHQFVAATARRWRFDSRVTLYNHTGEDVVARVLVRRADGRPTAAAGEVG